MAEGLPPHHQMDTSQAMRIIPTRPPPTLTNPTQFSEGINKFIERCLKKDPKERSKSIDLMLDSFVIVSKGPEVLMPIVSEYLKLKIEKGTLLDEDEGTHSSDSKTSSNTNTGKSFKNSGKSFKNSGKSFKDSLDTSSSPKSNKNSVNKISAQQEVSFLRNKSESIEDEEEEDSSEVNNPSRLTKNLRQGDSSDEVAKESEEGGGSVVEKSGEEGATRGEKEEQDGASVVEKDGEDGGSVVEKEGEDEGSVVEKDGEIKKEKVKKGKEEGSSSSDEDDDEAFSSALSQFMPKGVSRPPPAAMTSQPSSDEMKRLKEELNLFKIGIHATVEKQNDRIKYLENENNYLRSVVKNMQQEIEDMKDQVTAKKRSSLSKVNSVKKLNSLKKGTTKDRESTVTNPLFGLKDK